MGVDLVTTYGMSPLFYEVGHCRALTPLLHENILSFMRGKILLLSKYTGEHRKKTEELFFLFMNFFRIPYVITFFQKIPIFPMYLKFHASHMWAPPFLEPKKLRKNRKILVWCKFLKIKILYAYKSVTAIQRWIMSTYNPN